MKKLVYFISSIFLIFSIINSVSAIPNPAPLYCENMGYTDNGTNCIFGDGNSCESWAFYRGECGTEYVKKLTCKKLGEALSPGYECCEGLVSKNPSRYLETEGLCDMIAGSFGVCIACGNGECDNTYENKCNCAEDCDSDYIQENNTKRCNVYWEGYVYNPALGECKLIGDSGCTNPFEYKTKQECEDAIKTCDQEDLSKCDKSCNVDTDCVRNDVYCICLNKDVKVTNSENIFVSCSSVYFECKCQNNICTADSGETCPVPNCPNAHKTGESNGCSVYTCPEVNPEETKQITKTENNKIIEIDGEQVETSLKVVEDSDSKETKLQLSNGRNAEIKIMPETASEKAIERLGDLGFTIELKEVGKGDETKPVYELTGKKQGKFLGIFKIQARIQAQVDAETGEIIRIKKPWWSFLVTGI